MLHPGFALPRPVRFIGHALRDFLDDRLVLPALQPPVCALVALRLERARRARFRVAVFVHLHPAFLMRARLRQQLVRRAAVRVLFRLEDEVGFPDDSDQ
jgi:hypothetical protein